jgi:hypothetical protein
MDYICRHYHRTGSKITIVECATRSEAVVLESKIKKRGIKRYLQDISIL